METNVIQITINILILLTAYLVGSISCAIVVSKVLKLPDPRAGGSKNPGATNVLRLGSKKGAIITFLGDALKGFLPVFIVQVFLDLPPFMVGGVLLFAFLGHLYPLYFSFQGGKGVATAVGGLLGLNVYLFLSFIGTWALIAFVFRYSSLAAICAALLCPIFTYYFLGIQFVVPISVMVLFLLWRHRANIKRLMQGKETRLGQKGTS